MSANENPHDESTMNQQNERHFSNSSRSAPSFLGKMLAFALSATLFVLAFVFSLAALAVVAVVGVIFAGWLWWKTRAVRKQLDEMRVAGYPGGDIIEGEVVRETNDSPSSGKLLR